MTNKEEKKMHTYNSLTESSYLFTFYMNKYTVLDATRYGNCTRYINHYPSE